MCVSGGQATTAYGDLFTTTSLPLCPLSNNFTILTNHKPCRRPPSPAETMMLQQALLRKSEHVFVVSRFAGGLLDIPDGIVFVADDPLLTHRPRRQD